MIIFRAFLLLILWIPSSYGSELKTYAASAPYFNYSIDYPSNWELGDIYGFVQVTSSLESESDNFKENVKVTVSDLDKKPLSLEEFDALWLKMVPRELSNFKLVNEGKSMIGGDIGYEKEALFHIYTGVKDTKNMKCKRYTFKNNTNIYGLTYEAEEKDFDKYLPQAEHIIRSIKVTR